MVEGGSDDVLDLGAARRNKENRGAPGMAWGPDGELNVLESPLVITETEALNLALQVVATYSDKKLLLEEFKKESSDDPYAVGSNRKAPEARLEEDLKKLRFQAGTASMKTILGIFQKQKADPNAFHKVYLFVLAEELVKRLKPAK